MPQLPTSDPASAPLTSKRRALTARAALRFVCGVLVCIGLAGCSGSADEAVVTQEPLVEADAAAAESDAEIAVVSPEPELSDPVLESSESGEQESAGEPTPEPSPTPTDDELIATACDVLRSQDYETRLDLVESARDRSVLDTAVADCPDAFVEFEEAQAIAVTSSELRSVSQPVSLSSLRCANGEYSFIATNNTDAEIGVHLSLKILLGDDDEPFRSGTYPLVIWSLEPDAAQGITGEFDLPEDDDYRCNLSARIFNAADAGDASVVADQGEVDDDREPAEWFVDVLNREAQAVGSGDPGAAAETEDLRSMAYPKVRSATAGSAPPERVPDFVTVCNGTFDQPSDELASFVYYISYPANDDLGLAEETFLRHGLFRRGDDGKWRWLSAPQYFNAERFWGCGRPTNS